MTNTKHQLSSVLCPPSSGARLLSYQQAARRLDPTETDLAWLDACDRELQDFARFELATMTRKSGHG